MLSLRWCAFQSAMRGCEACASHPAVGVSIAKGSSSKDYTAPFAKNNREGSLPKITFNVKQFMLVHRLSGRYAGRKTGVPSGGYPVFIC